MNVHTFTDTATGGFTLDALPGSDIDVTYTPGFRWAQDRAYDGGYVVDQPTILEITVTTDGEETEPMGPNAFGVLFGPKTLEALRTVIWEHEEGEANGR